MRTAHTIARTGGTEEEKQMSARCSAKTTAGKPCRAVAVKGGLCSINADPKIAVEMGRKSGQARRAKDLLAQEHAELSPPRTAQEVRVALGQFIADVRSRRLDPKVAGTLGQLANVLLKSIEVSDVETRLANLETLLGTGTAKEQSKK
jgi:general stress protein YciG